MNAVRAVACVGLATAFASAECPPKDFDTAASFDLDGYISKRWYIQQQMETAYLPAKKNYCTYAEYHKREKKTLLGYSIDVHNHAEGKDGEIFDSGSLIQAKVVDEAKGKLLVAPWFIPPAFAGPYWVLAYDEAEGYALVSGGAPNLQGKDGKCKTGSGTNDSGLWIFTRELKRNDELVAKVRGIAESKGFDLSVLNDIDNSKCSFANNDAPPSTDSAASTVVV